MNRATTCCVLLVATLAAMPACTTKSLRAAYTSESQVVEPGVLGTWTNKEGKVTLDVSRIDSHYEALLTIKGDEDEGEAEKSVRLRVALFRAGPPPQSLSLARGPLFADASLTDDAWEATGLAKEFTVKSHAICRIDLTGDTLTIRELKSSALDELLKKDESALEHVHMDNDEVLLNAPAKRMMDVLATHANDDAFFNDLDDARTFHRAK